MLGGSSLIFTSAISAIIFSAGFVFSIDTNRDLEASLAKLPGLADSPDQGAFVELVKAMDEIYPGKIRISLYPYARSHRNVITGVADFHIPAMRNPAVTESQLNYRYTTEKIGSLTMVVYSHVDKKITKNDILSAMGKKGEFPYIIEVSAGAEANCPFPVRPTNDYQQSLKKLDAKRIDAIWNAQEETDLIVRQLRLKSIYRSLWGTFDDVIVVQKSPKGEEVAEILSNLLRMLRTSGKLEEIYRKIHLPYNDWQPSEMGY